MKNEGTTKYNIDNAIGYLYIAATMEEKRVKLQITVIGRIRTYLGNVSLKIDKDDNSCSTIRWSILELTHSRHGK